MALVDLKSKLNEFGENNPKNPYHKGGRRETALKSEVKIDKQSVYRVGDLDENISIFLKGLKQFGIDIPVEDNYENSIKRDSIFYSNETLNKINKVSQGFKQLKKAVKAFKDDPLKSISDLANVGQDAKLIEYRAKAYGKIKTLGDPGAKVVSARRKVARSFVGPIKGGKSSKNVDRVNITPYGKKSKDIIPFRFKDVYNNKWITFRAILSGITDTATAEYNPEKYIGRPDPVHIYTGTTRTIGFTFNVYPQTRQEMPVLWEKINYLYGLCYPIWVEAFGGLSMVSPLTNLTIGKLYKETPGFLTSVILVVPDNSTWEIEKDLELPHNVEISCEFTYVGKYLPNAKGKHFELNWLKDSNDKYGTFDEDGKIKRDKDYDWIDHRSLKSRIKTKTRDWLKNQFNKEKSKSTVADSKKS